MKTIILLVLTVLSFNSFANTYEVKCKSPFNPNGFEIFTSTEVEVANTSTYGTSIKLKDGAEINYSIAVQCKVIKKD